MIYGKTDQKIRINSPNKVREDSLTYSLRGKNYHWIRISIASIFLDPVLMWPPKQDGHVESTRIGDGDVDQLIAPHMFDWVTFIIVAQQNESCLIS